jgi:hypothetical protein
VRAASIALIVLASCSFTHGREQEVDAGVVAPPTTSQVFFTSVKSNVTQVRPGKYGFEVTAVLRNDLATEITDVGARLTFGGHDKEIRHRDEDRREGVFDLQPTTIAPGAEATYRFVVDALPWLTASDLQVNAAAVFTTSGSKLSATPAVTTAKDESNTSSKISFREALAQAMSAPGPDIITFDPSVFTPGTITDLDNNLGELPTISSDVVIDGTSADVTLALASTWESPEGRYGLRIVNGTVAVAGITFRNFALNYRDEMITTNNCGISNAQLEGGAMRVDGGTLILERNRFEDPDVAERNCYAASVRLHGGTAHHIVNNTWTDQVMNSIYVAAKVTEISDNVMIAPNNTDRDEEGIYIASQGGGDLWIVGNLIVDQEYSGIYAAGSDSGRLWIFNNTFVRNGRSSLAAIRRSGPRVMVLRNNLYIANNPSALQADNNGTGFDIAYETVSSNPLCSGTCDSAMIDMPTVLMPADPGVANIAGTTPDDFTPTATSPLIGSATPILDRNGGAPNHFMGDGQERGCVEIP